MKIQEKKKKTYLKPEMGLFDCLKESLLLQTSFIQADETMPEVDAAGAEMEGADYGTIGSGTTITDF